MRYVVLKEFGFNKVYNFLMCCIYIPLIVSAISEDGQEVLIYDERKHGYEPLLVKNKDFHAPLFQNYMDNSGSLSIRPLKK